MNERSNGVNGVAEGSGSRREGLYETPLGRWLTLFRIQSIPVSAVIASMGYLLSVESPILREILGLLAVAALAHAGINAQNDALDYHTDLRNKAEDKPLIAGDITQKEAIFMSSILVAFSVLIGYSIFPQSFWLLALSILAATLYNIYSSKKWWSMFIFGAWSGLFSMYGYSIGSGVADFNGLSLSVAFWFMMTSYIFLGDILDADADEVSAHSRLGATFVHLKGGERMYAPEGKINENGVVAVFAVWCLFLIAENVLYSGFDGGPIVITALMSFATYKAVRMSCYSNIIDDDLKKDFLLYVILTFSTLLVVYAPAMGLVYMIIMFLISLTWAMSMMKLLYGSWLYFP